MVCFVPFSYTGINMLLHERRKEMASSEQKEKRVYNRNTIVCVVAVVVGVVCDVRKYGSMESIALDWEFFVSLFIYVVLILLAVYSVYKMRKIRKENCPGEKRIEK